MQPRTRYLINLSVVAPFFVALVVAFASFFAPRQDARPQGSVVPTERAAATVIRIAPNVETDATPAIAARPVLASGAAAPPKAPNGRKIGGGEASYYGKEFAGRPTANGETFRPAEMTAAHRSLPFGSRVRVTNVRNGKSVIVRINDRGPYAKSRLIDVSQGAARKLGMIDSGTARVKLEVIS